MTCEDRAYGFWETVIGESNEIVYICAFDDLAHRERAWAAFTADPEWQAAKKASEASGPLIERAVNKIWRPTAYTGGSGRPPFPPGARDAPPGSPRGRQPLRLKAIPWRPSTTRFVHGLRVLTALR
jgi:hypothetical protein